MTSLDIAHQRLHNQHLSSPKFKRPADVVKCLGAVQAQDYYGAKWALAQRMQSGTDDAIEKAFAEGAILRTHVMRPTWHFVTPADIRWLLRLTAPRVNARNGYHYRKLELDDAVFRRSNKALASALRGGKQLTREELRAALQRAGIAANDLLRFIHLLIRAELDGVICSGARKGKQFTYALLDERAPKTSGLSPDEALAELTRRYFTSHGPATLQDFVWWSGLTATDARRGVEMVQRHVVKEVIAGRAYWLSSSTSAVRRAARVAYLLPAYDEYFVAYKDRSAALESTSSKQAASGNPVFNSAVVIGGRIVGGWRPTFEKSAVIITVRAFRSFSKAEKQAVTVAAHRYGAFLGMTPVLA
jgi:hypothetical protein